MIQNLATFSDPPPCLHGDFLEKVREGAQAVERRCPGIKAWIDRARNLVVFGPERHGGMTLFVTAVSLFKSAGGKLHPLGFIGSDSVDNVVRKLNSAKMPWHLKERMLKDAEKSAEHDKQEKLGRAVEDSQPEAEKFKTWVKGNLTTDTKFRKHFGME